MPVGAATTPGEPIEGIVILSVLAYCAFQRPGQQRIIAEVSDPRPEGSLAGQSRKGRHGRN